MLFPTMARQFWSSRHGQRARSALPATVSLVALLWAAVSGCGPQKAPVVRPLLLYCTPSSEAHAKVLKRVMEGRGGRQVVVAPMTGADMVAALEGLKAGDFAVIAGSGLRDQLLQRKLVRGTPLVYPLTVCAVSMRPLVLTDLGQPGVRLGNGPKDDDCAAAVTRVLPPDLCSRVAANTRQRGARGEERVRLVRLGALDAAFVWDTPSPAADLHVVRLPPDPSPCPLSIVALSCSRLSGEESAALLSELGEEATARALRGESASKGAISP